MRLSLIIKLALLTSLILVAFMTISAYVNLKDLRRLFLQEAASDTEKLSETIINTTNYQMLINDLPRVFSMIREVGTLEGIEHISLISTEGRVIFSTDESRIGKPVEKHEKAVSDFIPAGKSSSGNSGENMGSLIYDQRGRQIMGMTKAIHNDTSCHTAKCHFHPADLKVLGYLEVAVYLDKMQALLMDYRNRSISMTFILLILIWASITLCMLKLVYTPIKQLMNHARELGTGNLDARVRIASTDEMGYLALTMNEMTLKLKKSHDQLEEWGRTLERKVAERTQELERMQAQLIRSEKLASLGELAAGIAHEINNPLTGILVYSSLIKNDARLDPDLKNDLDTVIQETERCATIVRGLLDFSRASVPQKTWLSVHDVLDASLALVKKQAQLRNITINLDYCPVVAPIFADPQQLEQVFVNIFLNASYAMADGGTLTIATTTDREGTGVVVKIIDSGCGIPEENLPKIFDPFFTTKDSRGTGLGLSISYGIVESHGGTIEVESALGVGTTFIIHLPVPHGMTQEGSPEEGGTETG